MSTNTNSPEPTLEELQAFYDKCRYHDWYYEYADDHRSYSSGRASKAELQRKCGEHPKYKDIYTEWQTYMFSGKHTGTEDKPKPIRPE